MVLHDMSNLGGQLLPFMSDSSDMMVFFLVGDRLLLFCLHTLVQGTGFWRMEVIYTFRDVSDLNL